MQLQIQGVTIKFKFNLSFTTLKLKIFVLQENLISLAVGGYVQFSSLCWTFIVKNRIDSLLSSNRMAIHYIMAILTISSYFAAFGRHAESLGVPANDFWRRRRKLFIISCISDLLCHEKTDIFASHFLIYSWPSSLIQQLLQFQDLFWTVY